MPSPEQLSAVLQKHRPGTGGKSSRSGGRSNSRGHPMLLANVSWFRGGSSFRKADLFQFDDNREDDSQDRILERLSILFQKRN